MAQEPNPVSGDSAADSRSPGAKAAAPTSAEIRLQIEQTRAEMSQTVDAIQARLSPRRLVNDAAESIKDATVGRVKRLAAKTNGMLGNGNGSGFDAKRVIDTVRTNPIPFAIAGVAVAAFAAQAVMRSRNGSHHNPERAAPLTDDRAPALLHRRGSTTQRFLAGGCAGLACWSAWRAASQRNSGDAVGRRFEAPPPTT
jgi:Protein of unknown function (DUF3618)